MTYARSIWLLLIAGVAFAQEKPTRDVPLPKGAVRRFGTSAFRFERGGLDVSPDGKWLLASNDDTPVIVEIATGRIVWQRGSTDAYFSLGRFTADGKTLVLRAPNEIETWDVRSWKRTARHAFPKPDECPLLSQDGSVLFRERIVSPDDMPAQRFVDVLSAETGKVLTEHRLPIDDRASWCMSPGGEFLATVRPSLKDDALAVAGPMVDVFHRPTRRLRNGFRLDLGEVEAMTLSRDGSKIAIATCASVQVWDVATGKPERIWPADGPQQIMLFAHGGKMLVVSTPAAIRPYDVVMGKAGKAIRLTGYNPSGDLRELREIAGGAVLGWASDFRRLRLWDVGTGKLLSINPGHLDMVGSIAFTPDGTEVRSASAGGPPLRWEVASGKLIGPLILPDQGTAPWDWARVGSAPQLSRDGRFAMVPFIQRSENPFFPPGSGLALWDADAGTYVAHELSVDSTGLERGHSFSPDSRGMVIRERPSREENADYLRMFDLETARPGQAVRASFPCTATAFSRDGSKLAGIESTSTPPPAGIVLWDRRTGKRLYRHEFPGVTPDDLVFLNDRRMLLPLRSPAGADAPYPSYVLDIVRGKEVSWSEEPVIIPDLFLPRLSTSADGRLIAIPTTSGLAVYEIVSGSIRHLFKPQSPVSSVAFGPDGRFLASGHRDSTVFLWDLNFASDEVMPRDDEAIWKRLVDRNASKAWSAMHRLVSNPVEGLSLLQKRCQPVPVLAKVDAAQIVELIDQLSASRFLVREAASAKLIGFGMTAVPAIELARRNPKSEEAKNRLDAIYDRISAPEDLTPWLAQLRAIEVLERIASPAAIEHLKSLAAGGDAPPTLAAKQAVERLSAKVSGKK